MISRRDAAITLDWIYGRPLKEIAQQWRISVARANQIKVRALRQAGEPSWHRGSARQRASVIAYKIRMLCDAREMANLLNKSTPQGHWREVEEERFRDHNQERRNDMRSS